MRSNQEAGGAAKQAGDSPGGVVLQFSEPDLFSVHLVIQDVRRNGTVCFRVVAYSGSSTFRPAEFASIEELLQALHSAVPGFDASALAIRKPGYPETYIIFTGDLTLSETQMALLGLQKK